VGQEEVEGPKRLFGTQMRLFVSIFALLDDNNRATTLPLLSNDNAGASKRGVPCEESINICKYWVLQYLTLMTRSL
jgi:hypothetical protein